MRNEALILKYLPLARKLGRKYGSPQIDGEAEAQFAMVIAAQKFDAQLGGSFPLYAEYAIRNRLKRLRAKRLPQSVDWQAIEASEEPQSPEELAALLSPPIQERQAIRHDFVRWLLERLTRPEKRLLLLLLRRELQKDIAARFGVSQPTVSRRITALGVKATELIGVYDGRDNQGG